MKRLGIFLSLLCGVCLTSCDLKPKIASLSDSVGAFISDRYPALLADPEQEPEIYNSAVTDYGVYASPELYGTENINDYVLYASVDDYVLVPEPEETAEVKEETTEDKEIDDVLVPGHPDIDDTESEEESDDYIIVPMYGREDILDDKETEKIKEEKKEIKSEKKEEVKPIPEKTKEIKTEKTLDDFVVVAKGDTLYSISRKNNMTVAQLAKLNNLKEPYKLSIGQKLRIKPETPSTTKPETKVKTLKVVDDKAKKQDKVEKKETVKKSEKKEPKSEIKPNNNKRVDLQEITVSKGDTLYSISRKYEIPVNDLAVMNKLSVPFNLSIGQKLKVPKLNTVQTRSAHEIKEIKTKAKTTKTDVKKATKDVKKDKKPEKITKAKETKKIEKKTETKKQNKTQTNTSPHIVARSSSLFSWPVRGKILSQFGAKNSGLFNDGINISAARGTVVKAAENGVVAYAGNEVKGMGNLIIIQHSDGWMSVYAHLDSMIVHRGTMVNVGQQIGKIGQTGKVDKPQLHFEIRRGRKAYNPIQYLKK